MSRTNSPKSTPAMLLAPHSQSHTTIKMPNRSNGYAHVRALDGLSGSNTVSSSATSSSSLIIDNQGQAHDPGYLDALRHLHAQIGEMATASKPTGRRRLSPGSSTGMHRSTRPSALGLGLDSNMAAMDIGSDSSDDEDDDQQDPEPYVTLFEEARRHDATANRSLRSPAVLSSSSVSPTSTPTSAYVPAPSPGFPSGPPRSLTPRHTSFSTNADLDATPRSRQAHWSARRLSSPHHPTGPPPPSRPPAIISGTNDGWGFTGIVDVERERNNSVIRSGGDVSPGRVITPQLTASLLNDSPYAPASAPDSPKLVAAASMNRTKAGSGSNAVLSSSSGESPSAGGSSKLRQASLSQCRSKSLMKKNSSHDLPSVPSTDSFGLPSEENMTRRKSSLSNVHPPSSAASFTASGLLAKSPSLRRKFGVGSRKGSSRSRPSSSGAVSTHTVGGGEVERVRDFYTGATDDHSSVLSTIQSGKPIGDPNASLASSMTFSGTFRSSSTVNEGDSRCSSLTREKLEADLLQQREEADFLTKSSRFKDGLQEARRRGSEAADVGAHSYEIRRKMDMFTMGLRFNAFKAKRKLERGFKHHEA